MITVGADEDYDSGKLEAIFMHEKGPFLSHAAALKAMNVVVDDICARLNRSMGGTGKEGMMDLKAGKFRKSLNDEGI